MKKYRSNRFWLLTLFVSLVVPLWSQNSGISLYGRIMDRELQETLPGAHVQLQDTLGRMLMTQVSASDGSYTFDKVSSGVYQLHVTFLGFQPLTYRVNLQNRQGKVRVDDLYMGEMLKVLGETVITARIPEISVSEDTVMFHAGSYTVPEGSMVEELLKKLPGVEIDEYGKITANGKEVTQILVDGKPFFGNDTQMTLENIPADIIEKIKLYDKQSDEARITGVEDGNEKTVLDLSVKKDRKKGWFGQVAGGYGTEQRYTGKMNLNRFTDQRKFTVVGNAGNTRRGGTQAQQTGGFNFFLQQKKAEHSGNIKMSHSGTESTRKVETESFENETAPFNSRFQKNKNANWNLSAEYKLEWTPDSMTTILLRPNLTLGGGNSDSYSASASFRDNPFLFDGVYNPLEQIDLLKDSIGVNRNRNTNAAESDNWNGNLSLQYTRRLKKKGRNVSVNVSAGGGQNTNERTAENIIDYYQLMAANGGDSVYLKKQWNDQQVVRYNWNTQVSYNEPLTQNINLQLSYRVRMNAQSNNREVFSGLGGMALSRDTAQCQKTTNRYYNQDARVQVKVNRPKYFLTAGFSLQPQSSNTSYNKGMRSYDIRQTVFNFAPTANFQYRFSKQENLKFTYQGYSGQPDILNLIPDTLDNSNPLYVRLGNAALKPSFTHKVNFSYNRYLKEKQRSYAVNLSYQTTQNSVTQRTTYDEVTGARVSRPENIDGNWNGAANFNFNTAIGETAFRINSNSRLNYTRSMGYVYKNMQTLENSTRTTSLQEQLRVSYRNSWLDLGLLGSTRYNHSRSNVRSSQNLDTYHISCGTDLHVELPWNMKISTELKETSKRGYSDARMNTNEWVWNIQIAQSFLKRKAATVSLQVFDVLNQNQNVTRQITASSVRDIETEQISRYILLNFIYKINKFGGKKKK